MTTTVLAGIAQTNPNYFDDILSVLQNSKTLGDAAQTLGQGGQVHVLNEFRSALSNGLKGEVPLEAGITQEAGAIAQVGSTAEAAGTSAVMGAEASTIAGGSALNVIGAAFGLFDIIQNFGTLTPLHGTLSGLTVGAGIGSLILPGAGTLIGGAIGAVAGGLMSLFRKSGKDKDQKMRDQLRAALQRGGVLDHNYSLALADGTRFDIGIDGGPKKEFGGRRPFDIDLKDPLAAKLVSVTNPIAQTICGNNQKLSSDLVGYIVNAALSNAGGSEEVALKNMETIYTQFKPVISAR